MPETPDKDQPHDGEPASIPEAAPAPEPRFDLATPPAPEVANPAGRNTEF